MAVSRDLIVKRTLSHTRKVSAGHRHCRTSKLRNDLASSGKRANAGSFGRITWFWPSSETKRVPEISAAIRLPASKGTRACVERASQESARELEGAARSRQP